MDWMLRDVSSCKHRFLFHRLVCSSPIWTAVPILLCTFASCHCTDAASSAHSAARPMKLKTKPVLQRTVTLTMVLMLTHWLHPSLHYQQSVQLLRWRHSIWTIVYIKTNRIWYIVHKMYNWKKNFTEAINSYCDVFI